jgi:CTP synthase (UTP-ammonia lyase)
LDSRSQLFRIYRRGEIDEEYTCNYELNPAFQASFEQSGLCIAARGERREVRAVELSERVFFVATLFMPQLSSTATSPHPLITAFLNAAHAFRARRIGATGSVGSEILL